MLYGASPIAPARLVEALERFGPKLVQIYGQTECVGITTSLLREEHDPVNRPELLTSCGEPPSAAVCTTTSHGVDAAQPTAWDATPPRTFLAAASPPPRRTRRTPRQRTR